MLPQNRSPQGPYQSARRYSLSHLVLSPHDTSTGTSSNSIANAPPTTTEPSAYTSPMTRKQLSATSSPVVLPLPSIYPPPVSRTAGQYEALPRLSNAPQSYPPTQYQLYPSVYPQYSTPAQKGQRTSRSPDNGLFVGSGPGNGAPSVATSTAQTNNNYIPVNAIDPPIKTNDGKYQCRTCGRLYAQLKHLKRHAIMHSGITPYGCEWCKKRFTRPDICKRHMSTCPVKKHFFEKFCNPNTTDFGTSKQLQQHQLQQTVPIAAPEYLPASLSNTGLSTPAENLYSAYPSTANDVYKYMPAPMSYMLPNSSSPHARAQPSATPLPEHYDYMTAGKFYPQAYYYYPGTSMPGDHAQVMPAIGPYYKAPLLTPVSTPATPTGQQIMPNGTGTGLGIFMNR